MGKKRLELVTIYYVDPWKIENGGLHIIYALGVQIGIQRLKTKYDNHIKSGDILASRFP